jgi:hypothetical protein
MSNNSSRTTTTKGTENKRELTPNLRAEGLGVAGSRTPLKLANKDIIKANKDNVS